MAKDLTVSQIDRQNILNNEFAVSEIQKATNVKCIIWKGEYYLTKELVAEFFGVDVRTVERYITKNGEELRANGYMVLRGAVLKEFLESFEQNFATDIYVGHKIRSVSIFSFKAFLNVAMLLVESETAAEIRKIMLDIVIDILNQKAGGSTKYINQRDRDFVAAFLQEENYREEFTDALRDYVDMGNAKYGIYTDKIYQSIFREKAKEYKQVLRLSEKDRVRDTFYAEILTLISSYEYGLAVMIRDQATQLGRKLNNWELSDLFKAFESLPMWKPLVIQARTKMASRDMALRDAFHYELREYIKPLDTDEYDRFLGKAGDELEKLMEENQDVLKRLKGAE